MSKSKITNFLGLPELKFIKQTSNRKNQMTLHFKKVSKMEVCPKCALPSVTCYDTREVIIKDTPRSELQKCGKSVAKVPSSVHIKNDVQKNNN